MRLTWLMELQAKLRTMNSRRRRSDQPIETLESRAYLSVNTLFTNGELIITSNAHDSIAVQPNPSAPSQVQVLANGNPEASLSNINVGQLQRLLIIGSDGNNTIDLSQINASAFPALVAIQVDGRNGNDVITASLNLNDSIKGGDGADTIFGGNSSGILTIDAGDGADVVTGGVGADVIIAGDGNDNVVGGGGNDLINADEGDDTISGNVGNDTINGGDGTDLLLGDVGDDSINGEDGRDSVFGNDGNDVLIGGNHEDTIDGGLGDDNLQGQGFADLLIGNFGNDTLDGGGASDSMLGGVGNDLLLGGVGNDTMLGGEDNDSLYGGSGDDSIDGGNAQDVISGQAGNDTVDGNDGNDQVIGGTGNDVVIGGGELITSVPNLIIDDVVSTEPGLFLQQSTFNAALTIVGEMTLADINRDGNADIVGGAGGTVGYINGTAAGIFGGTTVGVLAANTSAQSTAVGDLDGDGDLDIAAVQVAIPMTNGAPGIQAVINAGGVLTASAQVGTPANSVPNEVILFNINPGAGGDADLDAIVTSTGTDTVLVYANNGAGVFAGAVAVPTGGMSPQEVVGAQFDGAGAPDIVVVNAVSNNLSFMAGTGATFSPAVLTALGITGGSELASGDFDGDGDQDIVVGGTATFGANLQVFLNDGTGIFASSQIFSSGGSVSDLQVADFDADADLDVAIADGFTSAIRILVNLGNGQFSLGHRAFATNATFLAVRNLVGDANPDLVTTGFQSGSVLENQAVIPSQATFNVNLSKPTTATVTVDYSVVAGSALDLTDVVVATGQVTFPAGTLSQTIDVGLIAELIAEPLEDYTVVLSNPVNAAITDGVGNGLIVDNDTGIIGPYLEVVDISAVETNGPGTVSVTVNLRGQVTSSAVVNFTTQDGTGVAGSEYTTTSGSLTFGPGATTQTVIIEVAGDLTGEADEIFYVVLSGAVGATIGDGRGTVTIVNDDGAIVPLTGDVLNGNEGSNTIVGGRGDDTITGGPSADTLDGAGGNDMIYGGAGDDSLLGNDGDDTLVGNAGRDTVIGGNGDDVIRWRGQIDGRDEFRAEDGSETIEVTGTSASDQYAISQSGSSMVISQGTGSITLIGDGLGLVPGAENVLINTGFGDDVVTLTDVNNVGAYLVTVNLGDGNDTFTANNAKLGLVRLVIDAGDGSDFLVGTASNDTIVGGLGSDSIRGGDGADSILAGDGDDTIDGQAGTDIIRGEAGNDSLLGGDGNDTIDGGFGNDIVNGGAGDDSMTGSFGDDNLMGDLGNDIAFGQSGIDSLIGGSGDDTLDGGRNDDVVIGNAGNDVLIGDHGNDFLRGDIGDDTILGGDGDDVLSGGDGNDGLVGGDGHDRIDGALGSDTILGGDGNDTLLGGGGDDIVTGDDGDDIVQGNSGTADTLVGGLGANTFGAGENAEINERFVVSDDILRDLRLL